MTVHSAKGLEFPYVFVAGMEENLFPSIQSLNSRSDLEEERRLFYVAITRAMRQLTLSYAESRYRWGNLTLCEPSRFLEEIPEKCIDAPKKVSIHPGSFLSEENFSVSLPGIKRHKATQVKPPVRFKKVDGPDEKKDDTPDDIEAIATGMDVRHERFGNGKVIALEGSGPNKKATVFFPGIGQKQLLLRFARLKIL
jgi:DNA helicase-2/ATP-dependent DNA helicase PcrA